MSNIQLDATFSLVKKGNICILDFHGLANNPTLTRFSENIIGKLPSGFIPITHFGTTFQDSDSRVFLIDVYASTGNIGVTLLSASGGMGVTHTSLTYIV